MSTRTRYHDEDYAYDYTNQPAFSQSRWKKEREARAQSCTKFESGEYTEHFCKNCYGPKHAHRAQALDQKAS